MHQSTCNIPIYPFRLITTLRFSKSNSIYRNYSFGFYSRFLISNHLKYISYFLYQSRFHFGISNQIVWKYEFQNITMHTNKYATKYRAPHRQGKGYAHHNSIYINVHLPHIGVGYTDDAPPTQESIHRPLTHTFSLRVTRFFSHILNHFISRSRENHFTT